MKKLVAAIVVIAAYAPNYAKAQAGSWLKSSEESAFIARLEKLWVHQNNEGSIVKLRITLAHNGRQLEITPMALDDSEPENNGHIELRDAAFRAIVEGQPYEMFPEDSGEDWRLIEITFDSKSGVTIIPMKSLCLNTISQMCAGQGTSTRLTSPP